jgi:aspartate aminotransferase
MSERAAPTATLLSASPTAALESKVEELLSSGVKVCRLGLGEPDIPTPAHVRSEAIRAIQEDFSKYTATAGIRSLREAAAERILAETGVRYSPSETIITVGAKHAIFNALAALCAPGDEVLLPVPYWVSFPEQIRYVGGVPHPVRTRRENGWRVSVDELELALTPRTRGLIFNSPNNPSGAVYTHAEQAKIARFCVERDLWVISDEIYSQFVFTAEGHRSIAAAPGMRERTVIASAISKTYGMTGWRIGYAAGPAAIVKTMATLQSHVTSNPSSIAQRAAVAALAGPHEWLDEVRARYRRRRDDMVAAVRRSRGLRCEVPDGAFFVWTDMTDWIGREIAGRTVASADDLAAALLDAAGVAVMPGTGFGDDTHLRLSFAAPEAELAQGLERMAALLSGSAVPA